MAIPEYNYIPKYIKRTIDNKPKDVVTASYWNELFNLLITQGDHTAEELGNILNHFTTVITDTGSELVAAIAEEHEYASAFEIHLSTNANPITADKTFAEIRQAIVDKREILLWVSEVQCLKPTCKAFEHTITLTVFDYSPAGPVVRADVYECYDEDEWFIKQNIELAKQNDIGDIRDLTTTHKYNLVAAVNEVKGLANDKYVKPTDGIPKTDLAAVVQTSLGKADTALQEHQSLAAYRTAAQQDTIDATKQDKLIAGDNIIIGEDGKTVSANTVGVFEVTLTTQSDGVSTADKTFEQVKAAVDSGIPVLKAHSDGAILWFFLLDKSPTEIDFVGLVDEQIIAYLTAKQDGTWETTVAARVTAEMFSALSDKLGNLNDLTTEAKNNLVAAINEAAQSGGGGGSVPKPLTYDYMPEGYPTKVMGVPLLKEQVVAFTLLDGIYTATIPNPSEIVEGQTYTVNWDGTEYECICGIFDSNPVIGNLSIAGGGDDTGETFLYMYIASQPAGQFGTLDTSASHTIAIKKQGEGIIPMAYYYMPEGYPKKTMGTATVMEEQEFSFEPDEGGRYKAVIPSAFEIVLGQTYIVKWDGTEYECVSFPIDQNEYAFGNLSIFGAGADTGVPFIYVPSSGGIFTLGTSPTHTISIKTTAETVTPMSAEFIPKMNVSAFTNDAGYLTLDTLPKYGGEVV